MMMMMMMMICQELVPFKSYIKNIVFAKVPLCVLLKHLVRLLTYL